MSEQFSRLSNALELMRRYRQGERSKPHKLLLLLAVLDLFDAGAIQSNQIRYAPALVERFSEYFRAIAQEGDWCQPGPPFFHLRTVGFWKHKPIAGREAQYAVLQTSGGGSKRILENIDYAYLDDDAYAVFSSRKERQALRRFIIESFFAPDEQRKLWNVVRAEARIAKYESLLETRGGYNVAPPSAAIRDAAFGRLIRRIYDYQCAMCGLRIIAPDGSTPIDAAHLIPWSETQDDAPTNGIALCKLHHWALDASLVAPTPEFTWVVSPRLDRRRDSERELTRFHRASILLPREEGQYPRPDAIRWRLDRLAR